MREFAPRCAWYTKNDGERDGCLSVSPRLISVHPVRRCGNRQAVKKLIPTILQKRRATLLSSVALLFLPWPNTAYHLNRVQSCLVSAWAVRKFRATELMQYRSPVVSRGPSSKT